MDDERGRRAPMRMSPLRFAAAMLAIWAVIGTGARAEVDDPSAPPREATGAEAPPPPADGWETAEAREDYDPWQRFNERMFFFNHDVLDRFVLKPTATAWNKILPDPAQRGLSRAFDNLSTPRRLVNNLLQLRPRAAGTELVRFLVNTTAGVVGFIDVAKLIHIEKSDADMGQTLGIYGAGPGPYLCLPFLPPLTVRDGIGRGIDGALDPIGYFIPFVAGTAMGVVNTINERSLNLQLFASVEDGVLDLYSAVRNGYLQRRQRAIEERLAKRRSPGPLLARASGEVP